jgi:CO/xanthine dehydrogenase Mo-binding subunit
LIFEYEISYMASSGFSTLHRITDTEQAQFVDDMYGVPFQN